MASSFDEYTGNNVFDFPSMGDLSTTITPGTRGPDVTELQRRVTKLGFLGVKDDGIYGPVTTAAIRAIQRQMQRPDNGIFDSFIDTTLTRATNDGSSGVLLESQAVSRAAQEFNRFIMGGGTPADDGSMTAGQALAVRNPDAATIQIPDETVVALWKKPLFWLGITGAVVVLYFALTPASTAPVMRNRGEDPDAEPEEGVEHPEAFFAEAPRRKRRKPKKRKPMKATAAATGDDLAALPPASPAEEAARDLVKNERHEEPEPEPETKPKRKRRARTATGQFQSKTKPKKRRRRQPTFESFDDDDEEEAEIEA